MRIKSFFRKIHIKTLVFVFSFAFLIVGGSYLTLKYSAKTLYAQVGSSSYWNVERDGSNNLNFYFVNNGANTKSALSVSPTGGITNGSVGADSGITGDRPYSYLYQEGGAWTSPFPDLILGYHTGMKLGAYTGYGGIKFYNDHPSRSNTQLFSIGDGDNNVRVSNWLMFPNSGYGLYAPENNAYLRSNTGYYGAWRVQGSRNGWGGLEFETPYSAATSISLMVGQSSQNNSNVYTGMHLNNVGWLWYASGSDMYAAMYRDISNGGYYLDPAGSSNLNGATFASGPYTNDWFRANGNNGLYFQSYGGGWHMVDSTYIRSYGNKPILAPTYYDQDNAGYYVDPANVSNMNYVYTANGSHFPYAGNNWNYIRGNSYIAGDTGVILSNGYVGIGTTSPQGKMAVGFGNGDQLTITQPMDDALGIQTTLNGQPNNGYGGHGANRLVLQPTVGYVGIKTPNPTADLHIKQSDQSQWGGGGIKLERSSAGYARIFMGDDQQLYLFTNSNSHYCIVTISASISCSSDGRLKNDISPLNVAALDIINKLKPSTFTWKAGGKHSAGFIAQEVEEVLPDAVTRNESDGYLSVSDSYITPYLVKSIQELDAKTSQIEQQSNKHTDQIKALTEQLKAQQTEIEYLKQAIEELKKR
jgi:hypothetical protein